MTLLYGKAANGTYYPVQVDDSGRIIAIYGQDALVRPDLTAEFKSVVLDDFASRNGPGLGYYEQGPFSPRLASCDFEGTGVVPGTVDYAGRGGLYQVIGRRLVFNCFLQTSSVSGLTGPVILIDGIPKPVGYSGPVAYFSMSVEYIVGYDWDRVYPMLIQGYLALGGNGFGFMPNVAVPAGGYPEFLASSGLSATSNIIYANGEIWM